MNDKKLAQVFHYDLFGKREEKYEVLKEISVPQINWSNISINVPNYFFISKYSDENLLYQNGYKIDELFLINTSGIKTHNDSKLVSFSKFENNNQLYFYRPFDNRNIEYDLKKVVRHRISVMKNFLAGKNLSIITCRQQSTYSFQHSIISDIISDINSISLQTKEISFVFPLYLISHNEIAINKPNRISRIPNLNPQIVQQLAGQLGLTFTPEKEPTPGTFAPIDILDYIYAILHSPIYRAKYKEFLKIDFPRIPYPKDQETFWKFVKLGGELRQIHLLESPVVERFITSYPVGGTNEVVKVKYEEEKVWINESQYFDHVPQVAWEFYIGGYQPAQKWLKDRKGRQLSFEDVRHYQKIIVALTETNRIMKEIDKVEFE